MKVVEFLFQSIPLIIQLYADQYLRDDLANTLKELEEDSNLPRIKTYDFIVVGGGSAGCVVAGRLSENFNVLLLEAGGTPPPAASNPYFATRILANADINYIFKSVPQEVGLSYGGIVRTDTGKMLGGSGSHNDMTHNRGSPKDFDNWAEITGDASWAYENVYKYFAKSETFYGQRYGNDSEGYYGTEGPIQVGTNVVPILPVWFEAGKELGYATEDPNGFQSTSFTALNKAIGANGHRSSSYIEYIKPFEQVRENLTVIRYANVSEILLNENNEAYGVAYSRHGFPQISYASKEIILSAGAFSSPLLLMKSGIGPVDQLNAAGIPVKVPLDAVGKGMSEHPSIIISDFYVDEDDAMYPRIRENDTEKLIEDFRRGEGIFTMLLEGPQCFVESTKATPGWPDLWIEITPKVRTDESPQTFSFFVVLGRPQSRGSIGLNGTLYREGVRDDTQLALIDFGLVTHPDDMDALVEGIKFAFRIAEETTAFKNLGAIYRGTPEPACTEFEFRSDEYWRCFIVQRTLGWIHMGGSCGMGPDEGESVVDSKLRVKGVPGLRVVDASIMPAVPNANLNAPVLMIAEKASDEITYAWSNQL